VTLTGVLLAIPAMILGFLVGFLLSAAITSLAFWTTRVYSIHEFYYALQLLFSGQFVPLTLMPKLIQDIAQYLPFQLLIYFPIQLILGKLSTAQIMQGYVNGCIWLIVAIAVFNWVWRNGVKRYSAVGA
jgi:ABC-2 type transport system permease protein